MRRFVSFFFPFATVYVQAMFAKEVQNLRGVCLLPLHILHSEIDLYSSNAGLKWGSC